MDITQTSTRTLTTHGPGRPVSWASSLVIHAALLAMLALIVNPSNPPLPPNVIDTALAGDDATTVDSPMPVSLEVSPQEQSSQDSRSSVFLTQVTSDEADSAPQLNMPGDADPSSAGMVSYGGLSENVGALRGGGTGDGSGDMGVSGAGTGKKNFFGMKVEGKRIVFVVDASSSMHHPHFGPGGTRFRRVQIELINSVLSLKEDQEFFVTFFSSRAWPMPSTTTVLATQEAKKTYMTWVAGAKAGGRTEPEEALRLALALCPDVIFFLTDGQFDYRIGPLVTQLNQGRAIIHTVAVGEEADLDLMQKIASANRGRFRFIPSDERLLEQEEASAEAVSAAPVSQKN